MEKEIEIQCLKANLRDRGKYGFPNRPLEDLYEWRFSSSPYNNHALAFAGDGLWDSNLFDDVEEITIVFFGEDEQSFSKEAWANPLRVDILRRLAGEDYSWYIGYRRYNLDIIDNYSEILLNMHIPRLRRWNLSDVVFVDSGRNLSGRRGVVKKPVFEVKISELDVFVHEVWPKANCYDLSIEGYCMQPGKLDLLREWNERERTPELFKEVMDECLILFHVSQHDHLFFHFITNKMDVNEFSKIIDFTELENRAKKL